MRRAIPSSFYSILTIVGLFLLTPPVVSNGQGGIPLNNMRAIHIGGNWGANRNGIPQQSEEYYSFLRSLDINWAGFSIGLHVSNSMDATVERVYNNVPIPTFDDNTIINTIRGFKNHNINVMVAIGIETQEAAQSDKPVNRWQFGDPNMPASDPNIKIENWPWAPTHPQYTQFVQSWWNSYTNEVVYFAKIAEREGVKMFAVGAEMDRLFRTRAGGSFANHFKDYIKTLVDSVRKYFSGYITYELHWGALSDPAFFGPGSDHLWEDAGLDVVGVSSYFKLVGQQPNRILGVDELEAGWNNIFANYLIPLQNRNPGKKIVFHEFGYTDVLASPYNAIADEFTTKVFTDINGNGKDDGEEQQSNMLESFYKVNETKNRLVSGTFLWDNYLCSNIDWTNSFGAMRTCSIRNKLAQNIIDQWYATYTPLPGIPLITEPSNGALNIPTVTELKWQAANDAANYEVQVSESSNFFSLTFSQQDIVATRIIPIGLLSPRTYYWHVRSKNGKGESGWSTTFSFSTVALPNVPLLESPANGAINIPLDAELKWGAALNATSYDVQVSQSLSFISIELNFQNITNTKVQLNGILSSKTYYWHVKAKNNFGESTWSQTFSFTTVTTFAIPLLEYPANGALNISLSTDLRWQSVSGATLYDLQVSEISSFAAILQSFQNISDLKVRLSGLLISKTYYWHVKAKNSNYESGWSQTFSFSTYALPTIPVLEYPSNNAENTPLVLEFRWQTSMNATAYDIEASENQNFSPILFSLLNSTNNKAGISGLKNGKIYYWHVKAKNNFGESLWSQTFSFTTQTSVGVEIDNMITEFRLYQNYPNPFNPVTNISYKLARNCKVALKIYDFLGKEVVTLISGHQEPGFYTVQFSSSKYKLSSGIYFYSLTADALTYVRPMLLIQ